MGSKSIDLDARNFNSWRLPNGLIIADTFAESEEPMGFRVMFHDMSERAIKNFVTVEGVGDNKNGLPIFAG